MPYLVLDVGGSAIKYALMEAPTTFLEKGQLPTPLTGFADFAAVVAGLYRRYRPAITGLALSLPGCIDSERGYAHSGGLLEYNAGRHLVRDLQALCPLPISLENDGKCAALAEARHGSLQGCRNGAVVVLGSGIGGGLILEGRLYKGSHFAAGEFSFLRLNGQLRKGEPSPLWASEGSALALCRQVAEAKGRAPETVDGHQVFSWVEAGDPVAGRALDDYCYGLAIQLCNLQHLFDPERIAIGGGISAQPLLMTGLQRNLDYLASQLPVKLMMPAVVRCQFMNDANLIGALEHHRQGAL